MRGDMRGEERRDNRSIREDGGRKRHSEEGMDSRGREKRPRR
jgi:THO complex subunit 2